MRVKVAETDILSSTPLRTSVDGPSTYPSADSETSQLTNQYPIDRPINIYTDKPSRLQ